jgi:hypothetical protein
MSKSSTNKRRASVERHSTRTVIGEYIHHTTLEEVLQLLGYDAADVVEVVLTPTTGLVTTIERTDTSRTLVTHRHVVR